MLACGTSRHASRVGEYLFAQLKALIAEHDQRRKELAHWFANTQDVIYVGRGINYPIALEGALKLKEIS